MNSVRIPPGGDPDEIRYSANDRYPIGHCIRFELSRNVVPVFAGFNHWSFDYVVASHSSLSGCFAVDTDERFKGGENHEIR